MKFPSPIQSERLKELSSKAHEGTLTPAEKDELILGHVPLAIKMARNFAQHRLHLREELISEALLAIVQAVQTGQGRLEGNTIGPWIRNIIRNRLRDFVAKSKATASYQEGHTSSSTFRYDEEAEDICRDELDEQILQLRYDGQSDREIAQQLQIA